MALGSWLIWFSLGGFEWQVEFWALVALFSAQFFGLFIGRAAYIKAHEYLPISQLSFLMLGIPVLSLLGGYWFLQEPLGAQKIVGAAVMLVGLTWFISRKAKREELQPK